MTMRSLNDLCHRVIHSDTRLRQLKQMHAPDVIVRNDNRVLQDAMIALLNNDEVTQIVDHVGTDAFVNYFNYIAGTEIRFPIAATASASLAA